MKDPQAPPARIAVVMGVSGCGKTTIGHELAERLGVPFADADTFHPPANITKMSAGHSLTDEDRRPWLARIGAWLAEHHEVGAVATCSALKRDYRDLIRAAAPGVPFLHLAGPMEVAYARVAARPNHFMPASLMRSQYDTLQPLAADETGLTLDFNRSADEIVTAIVDFLTTSTSNPEA
ncbi:gluconate kinase [Enemella dayhoffiae]|uniref:Gluconokinase n=1 Tax=Enemella dayhoffiae TaxID=2016507 RepID=A0A255HBL6_9ACTN|nr:gluconokinase [Enemella dayhoffiae]OYO24991.1 gluconate kinase [Enemella dayhoffiae]